MELLSMNGYFGSSIPKRKRAMKRKRKTTTTTTTTTKKKKPSTTPSPSLPDDLILNIIARLSILYYPTLSLVSKSFRSLLTSPELYKTRSRLGHTERCLYVCFTTYTCCVWFTLCRKPDQTLSKSNALSKINGDKKKSGHVLAKVPIPHSPKADASGLVAVGSDIYNIGKTQSHFKASSSTVFVLDCTTHTWREAPRLPEELFIVSANVLDGKIYVAGRSLDGENDSDPLKNSFEVFDTRTQVWDPNPIPCIVAKDMSFFRSACLDGKFHVTAGSKEAAYNVKEGRWDLVRPAMSGYMFSDSHCAIDNVLYCFSDGAFKWYDTDQVGIWKNLKGLVDLPKFPYDNRVRLVDYDGKMVVFWVDLSHYGIYYEHMIWCAEIALERRKSCEIWGKVEWCDHVLTVPLSHKLEKAVAATL